MLHLFLKQLNYYKKKKLIEYKDYKRILKGDSLDDIEIVNCNTQLVKIKNEILSDRINEISLGGVGTTPLDTEKINNKINW